MYSRMRRRRRRQQFNLLLFLIIAVFMAIIIIYLITIAFSGSNIQASMNQPDKGYMIIRIQSKDTLWSIASEYMDSDYYTHKSFIEELVQVNQLEGDKIYAGNDLMVPILSTH